MTEALHQAALLPLIAMMVLGRKVGAAWWLLAVAFAMSWVGDSFAFYLDGAWAASYSWLPVQFALALVAFLSEPMYRLVAFVGVLLLTVTSIQISAPGPEWVLTLGASAALMAVAQGPLTWPVMVYFGFGSLAYLVMVSEIGGAFLPAWYAYQGCRMVAYALFLGLLVRERRSLA